jgi:hypothetical protein
VRRRALEEEGRSEEERERGGADGEEYRRKGRERGQQLRDW